MQPTTVILSVVNTKGGAGTTTTAANLGGLAAALGQRTLLIDADVQPALTKYFATLGQSTSGMNEVIARGGMVLPEDIIETNIPNLSLLPSNLQDHVQAWLKEREDRLIMLKRALRAPVIREHFDLVIIDTQGAKGELQRTAAMAADLMVSPIKPDMLNYSEFCNGTLEMLNSLNAMADIVPEMKAGPLAIFVNALTRTTNARTIDEAIRTQFRTNPSIRLLDTKVPQSNAFVSGRTYRQPVHEIDPPGKSAQSASFVMHSLLHELLPHLKGLGVEGHRPADLEVGK